MAATDTTQESTLIIPDDQVGNVSKSESGNKTVWNFSENTSGLTGEISQGKSVFRGSSIRRSTFSFSDPDAQAKASYQNNVNNVDYIGTDKAESLRFSGNVRNVDANMGGGPDSILFGRNSAVQDTTIDLGKDTGKDIVEFASLDDVKNTKIKNFGKQDILKIGGQQYTYKELQNADFGNKLTIKFQD